MANIDVDYLPYMITAPDALDNSIVITAPHSYQSEKPYIIEVISGLIQFRLGAPAGANSPSYTVGSKIVLTGLSKTPIFYKAGSGGDQFIVTF